MKKHWINRVILTIGIAAGLLMTLGVSKAAGTNSEPQILNIFLDGTNIVVRARVSPKYQKVMLESSVRLGRRAWQPRGMHRFAAVNTNGPAVEVTFRIPVTADMELLRVRGDFSDPLPASFYTGITKYQSLETLSEDAIQYFPAVGLFDNLGAPGSPVSAPAERSPRQVVEADIWKLSGNTLFFFNQYRGLQVIDVTDPDSPNLIGSFTLNLGGEDMYVIGTNRVVLIARDNCYYWNNGAESRVLFFEINNGVPTLTSEMGIPGHVQESRLVGSSLYLVSSRYGYNRLIDATGSSEAIAEQGSEVISIDITNFDQPVKKKTHWLTGYANAIYATDAYLFVAQNKWVSDASRSEVSVFDISSIDGNFEFKSRLHTEGQITDKFKMNYKESVFSAIGSFQGSVSNRWVIRTIVQTFSLTNAAAPVQLGHLNIIENEQLHATRFDGDKLYAVTFLRIDPLWIIDLSDPANPRRVGELEIPGWSTYIHPLGDRLLTIGVEVSNSWRTTVQLFDVANPAKPALLSKIYLGEQWSSSEAQHNEKAFTVVEEAGLVAIPFSAYNTNHAFIQGVQLIDFGSSNLVKRGIVERDFTTRRTALHKNRLLAISAQELVTIDLTDRDNPEVVNDTVLAWKTDRLHLAGDYLLQIENDVSPLVHISLATDLTRIVRTVALTNLNIISSVAKNGKLYVLQGQQNYWYNPVFHPWLNQASTNLETTVLSVYDLGQLPELPLLGQAIAPALDSYSSVTPLWPKDNLLIWFQESYTSPYWYFRDWAFPPLLADSIGGLAMRRYPYWWGNGYSSRLLAFSVAPEGPRFVSDLKLTRTNGNAHGTSILAANGLVFASYVTTEYQAILPITVTNQPHDVFQQETRGEWHRNAFLDVIDYSDPSDPVVRAPVNISAPIMAISHGGSVLYTQGLRKDSEGDSKAFYLDALAYDGVEAHLIDSVRSTNEWIRSGLVHKDQLILATSVSTNSALETWTLSTEGKLAQLASLTLSSPLSEMLVFGELLVTRSSRIHLYDASNPLSIKLLKQDELGSCLSFTLKDADGDLDRGLWVPLGWYGTTYIPVHTPATLQQ
ncbi:MAG: beta-propeller domain-containing protein [Verrucomicrobiota bacterium]|nr:beta-propeller domain-containing protein [Verrucomicrobiota bacterium]